MVEVLSNHGFAVAEQLEPVRDRDDEVSDLIGVAEYLAAPTSPSRAEVERATSALSAAAHEDRGLLVAAWHRARARARRGQTARRVAALLARAVQSGRMQSARRERGTRSAQSSRTTTTTLPRERPAWR
jgi:hypothetical protein